MDTSPPLPPTPPSSSLAPTSGDAVAVHPTADHAELASATARRWWERLERWAEWGSEQVNPILVKEARQALKSNHFVVTFLLLLACAWGWSLLGILAQMPDIQFNGGGLSMLEGYFFVMIVPLLLVVPFSAFRSLAAEREDGTFELMSITTLNARQIVAGKLASTFLQIMLYASALTPCIAFTYLLRGVDVLTICFVIYYTVAFSIFLSTLGLLIATVTRARHWQILLSIVLLLGLLIALWTWAVFVVEVVFEERLFTPAGDPLFWLVQLALACGYISLGVLMVQAAASRITFSSDNRSTRQRVTILIQHAMLLGWMSYFFYDQRDADLVYVTMILAGMYAAFTGGLMIGEQPQLSPRVARSLPKTAAARLLFTLFNPGSGTGYLYTVANLTAVLVTCVGMGIAGVSMGRSLNSQWLGFILLIWAYVTAYLGLSRLVVLGCRRLVRIPETFSILVVAILATAGIALPLACESSVRGISRFDYSVLQSSNWFWTLEQAERLDMLTIHPEVMVLVIGAALLMILANMALSRRELSAVVHES
ncbi:MAG: hypothetical protein U0935_21595 [Pirellulales bacterium]